MRDHPSRRTSEALRATVAALLLAVPLFYGPAATAQTDLCGTTVLDDLKLDQDLSCPATGLIVGADGILLNLQGHTISGSGSGTGIVISGRANVTVTGGTVANFATGVLVAGSTDVDLKALSVRDNADGIDLQAGSTGTVIKNNDFVGNRTRAIMLRAATANSDVKNNTLAGNRVGILMFAPTNTTVKGNTVTGSTLAGIRVNLDATGNLVLDNAISSNPVGIDFLPGPSGGPVGNSFVGNTLSQNVCGLKGPLGGNTFKETTFEGNTTDVCG